MAQINNTFFQLEITFADMEAAQGGFRSYRDLIEQYCLEEQPTGLGTQHSAQALKNFGVDVVREVIPFIFGLDQLDCNLGCL